MKDLLIKVGVGLFVTFALIFIFFELGFAIFSVYDSLFGIYRNCPNTYQIENIGGYVNCTGYQQRGGLEFYNCSDGFTYRNPSRYKMIRGC